MSTTFLLQTRRKLISLVGGDDAGILSVLGANFSAGVVAGTLAAGATCPLDVAKTRRQIEVCFIWFWVSHISCIIYSNFKGEGRGGVEDFTLLILLWFSSFWKIEVAAYHSFQINCYIWTRDTFYMYASAHLVLFSCHVFCIMFLQMDHVRALKMTTRQTLIEIWRYAIIWNLESFDFIHVFMTEFRCHVHSFLFISMVCCIYVS